MNNTLTAEILHKVALKNAKAEIAAMFEANPNFVANVLGLDTDAKREAWAVESVLDGSYS